MHWSFFIRRMGYGCLSLFILSLTVFCCTQLLPGDAATMILGDRATPESLEALRQQLSLDRSAASQYIHWLTGVLSGDLGRSMSLGQPVSAVIWERFGNSLQLAIVAFALTAIVGLATGVLAALRQGKFTDVTLVSFAYVSISIPEFILGPLLIIVLAAPPLQLLPSSGRADFLDAPADWFAHLVMPVLTLGAVLIAHVMRQARSGTIAVLQTGYVRAARLAGIREGRVIAQYVLPNALPTAIAVLAIDIGYLMGSVVIVEEIFAYPGLGRLTLYAITNRDLQLIQACTLVIGAVYVLANLAADMLIGVLDPRRMEGV